jgi:hypothetical protein
MQEESYLLGGGWQHPLAGMEYRVFPPSARLPRARGWLMTAYFQKNT